MAISLKSITSFFQSDKKTESLKKPETAPMVLKLGEGVITFFIGENHFRVLVITGTLNSTLAISFKYINGRVKIDREVNIPGYVYTDEERTQSLLVMSNTNYKTPFFIFDNTQTPESELMRITTIDNCHHFVSLMYQGIKDAKLNSIEDFRGSSEPDDHDMLSSSCVFS